MSFGALVQLVRMPACHAGGHGFESRTHRKKYKDCSFETVFFLFLSVSGVEHFLNTKRIITARSGFMDQ